MSRIKVTNLRHESATSDNISLDSSGQVGIGTTSPQTDLHIGNGTGNGVEISNTGTLQVIDRGNSRIEPLTVTAEHVAFSIARNTSTTLHDERARVTYDGLTFNGDTAAANALDDYEEGTWTPVFKGGGVQGSYTISVLEAKYTKIGRMVHINANFSITTINSAGNAYAVVEGMPFDVGSWDIGSASLYGVDVATAVVQYHVKRVSSSTDHRLFFGTTVDNANGGDIQISEFSAGDRVILSLTYVAA